MRVCVCFPSPLSLCFSLSRARALSLSLKEHKYVPSLTCPRQYDLHNRMSPIERHPKSQVYTIIFHKHIVSHLSTSE